MTDMKKYCVYIHTNKINKKVYIGQTCQNPETRWKNGEGYIGSPHFYRAIQKYGWNNFTHEIIAQNLTLEESNALEEKLIKDYNALDDNFGYNIATGGKNSIMSDLHKKHLSESNIGKHCHIGELNPMYGKHFSDETKKNMRLSQPSSKKVCCIETGEIFNSAREAAKRYNLASDGHIPQVCQGKRSTAGGKHWKYTED